MLPLGLACVLSWSTNLQNDRKYDVTFLTLVRMLTGRVKWTDLISESYLICVSFCPQASVGPGAD